MGVRCFLLLQRCDSIRPGTKFATIPAFRNWPQKRNRDVGKIFAELAVCGVKEAFASRCDGRKNVRRYSNFSALKIADSSSTNAVSFSSARTMKRFPSPRCASAIQIVRPRESIAETQPQLQPALLRLSAMISQYFICDDSDLVMIRAHLKDFGSTSVMNSKLHKLSLDHPAISPIPLPSLRLLNALD